MQIKDTLYIKKFFFMDANFMKAINNHIGVTTYKYSSVRSDNIRGLLDWSSSLHEICILVELSSAYTIF